MNLIPVETCIILVFFTQATQLCWLLEDTRYVCVYEALLFAIFTFIVYLFYIFEKVITY